MPRGVGWGIDGMRGQVVCRVQARKWVQVPASGSSGANTAHYTRESNHITISNSKFDIVN
jgi:hypothetical protein